MRQKVIKVCFCFIILSLTTSTIKAQSFELEQLILNLEKLNQLKAILQQLKDGYVILTKGYNTIKDISEGNFNLHKSFLDGLLAVSPTVRRYKRIGEIVVMQRELVKKSRDALSGFTMGEAFNSGEIDYLERVYNDLINRSIKNMDELLMVITANQLRMNDADRLAAIDRIYGDVSEKMEFLKSFNQKTDLLTAQRKRGLQENKMLKKIYSK